jgi:hypothetical protein
MKISRFLALLNTLLVIAMAFNINDGASPAAVPVTGAGNTVRSAAPLPDLATFIAQVENGNNAQVTGIYSEGLLALPVVQQPADQPGFIATAADTATQFGMAATYGSLGFLAHNYLAGSLFYNLAEGTLIKVVYGDGHTWDFVVSEVRHFQAVSPNDPYSQFIDVETGATLTASDVFFQTYGVAGQAVFQTCIDKDGIGSWGRLFVIATPYVASMPAGMARQVEKFKAAVNI